MIRERREDRGWSRAKLARRAGVTTNDVCRLEMKGATEADADLARRVEEALDRGYASELSWRGLSPGDRVKVTGEPGQWFTFVQFVAEASTPYVSLRCERTGGERCILPDRIRTKRGKVPVEV